MAILRINLIMLAFRIKTWYCVPLKEAVRMENIIKTLYDHLGNAPEKVLAWQIANEIQNYGGCSDCSQRAEPDTRQLFSKEVTK
jgi:hypothetical protein